MQNSESGSDSELLDFRAGECPSSLLRHIPGVFLSLQDYSEVPVSKVGSLRHPSKGASLLKIRIYLGMRVSLYT